MKYLLSILYCAVVRFRTLLYSKGILKSRTLSRPVISVGNLTVGGTGKTPYVAFLAALLKDAGFQPVILSRGYGGSAEKSTLVVGDGTSVFCGPDECGDEPYLLARKLKGVPVVVGQDRYRSARSVENQYKEAIFILDDGYQHLRLKRNLNILLLDATDPFGAGRLLPAGRLREPVEAIARADLVVITRSQYATEVDTIEDQIRRVHPTVPISCFHHDALRLYDLRNGSTLPLRAFLNKAVVALAAIGNPDLFLRDLRHYQMRVADQFFFRDHHRFAQRELDQALRRATALNATLVTTEKDAVRLEVLRIDPASVFVLEIEARAEEPEDYRRFLLNELENLPPAQ